VLVIRRHRLRDSEVFVVHQPDGTLAQIPCWMMSESAARHELRAEPRIPLEHLRNLRIELDCVLHSLRPESGGIC